ncbi:hypothetical protein [Persicirhabdus sediminis]|uniref:Uncharacterized protein n=1 Tax=Persicirhabdus sediminis TaxID=454144 RepID=A0A8J7MC55_9BACT|nr:hypothetical protein [Persicirhabdus sediminis]MBK1789755.1 hypothetical protein [Persicirhabdus sediminis]
MKKRSYLFMLLLALAPFFTNCGGGGSDEFVIRPLSMNGVTIQFNGGTQLKFTRSNDTIGVGEIGAMEFAGTMGIAATDNGLTNPFYDLYWPTAIPPGTSYTYEWTELDPSQTGGNNNTSITLRITSTGYTEVRSFPEGPAYTILAAANVTPTIMTMTFSTSGGGVIDNTQVYFDDSQANEFDSLAGLTKDIREGIQSLDKYGRALTPGYNDTEFVPFVTESLVGKRVRFSYADGVRVYVTADGADGSTSGINDEFTETWEEGVLTYIQYDNPANPDDDQNMIVNDQRRYRWTVATDFGPNPQTSTLIIYDTVAPGVNDVITCEWTTRSDYGAGGTFTLNNPNSDYDGLEAKAEFVH